MIVVLLLLVAAIALVTGNLLGTTVALFGLVVLQVENSGNFTVLSSAIWNLFNNMAFTAIPVFILLGELLGETQLARRIYSGASPLFERLPGKLLQTNIATSTIFSAVSGSSTATSAVVGAIAYDELSRRGYDRAATIGSIAGGGTLGIMIPPSLAMIVYGAWQGVSIGSLFLAGILPGLLIATFFSAYIAISARIRPQIVPSSDGPMPLGRALAATLGIWPILALIGAVLGTIFLGLATPTEAAALGVVTAIILAIAYREFSLARLWRALVATTLVFSAIALIMVGAVILSQAVALAGLPQALLGLVTANDLPGPVVLVLVYLVYLVLGCLVGPIEMLLITLPFTFPLVTGLGYDPVWFGVAVVILIEIGLLTPPVGTNIFVMMAISKGRLQVGETARACLPYWMLLLAGLALITLFPGIALFLPRLFY